VRFSVLMSIYYKEKPEYFNRAMQSIWDEQTIKPNEIVLVQDGKLTEDLYGVIDEWKNKLVEVLKIVPLEKNVGLGDALNEGIKHCNYELIARMDTDDIALPNRFEKQLKVLENSDVDVISSWVSEFEDSEKNIVSLRKVPETQSEIVIFAKKRNPVNHPSVMYRKNAVLAAGSYQNMIGFEAYYLWICMLQYGSKMANIPEVLVNMRAGYSQLERRGGVSYIKNEIIFQRKLLEIGFLNKFEFMKNIAMRVFVRIMPNNIRGILYKIIRKER